MLNLDQARLVADYLRAKGEVRRASLGTLLGLLLCAVFAVRWRVDPSWHVHAAILLAVIVVPWVLRALPFPGGLRMFRLELVSFPFNALILGFILFLEAYRLPLIEVEGVPAMRWLFPALSLLVAIAYLFVGFSDWLRRMKRVKWIENILAVPPIQGYLDAVDALLEPALNQAPRTGDAWAQFRTVPASARNLKLFLQLDTARHGIWRVAFDDDFALVALQDGSLCEAVAPGGIHLAVDDAPRPGERERMILIRWNEHLHEGRILRDDQLKIQSWFSRSKGFESGSSVPDPGF